MTAFDDQGFPSRHFALTGKIHNLYNMWYLFSSGMATVTTLNYKNMSIHFGATELEVMKMITTRWCHIAHVFTTRG